MVVLVVIERETDVSNHVVSLASEVGQIHLNIVQSDLHQQSTLIGKMCLPCSNQPSHFFPPPASSVSSSAAHPFVDPQPQGLMPF